MRKARFTEHQTSRDKLQKQKSPQGLRHAGFRLHRMTLVITDGEFWWSWRELNPRPKFLHLRYYMLSLVFTFACQLRTDTPLTN